MLFSASSTPELLANIGAVSSDVTASVSSWVYFAVGIPLAFYILYRVVALIPKGKK
jgi:hypothetical protein